jgi:hypothetical protein
MNDTEMRLQAQASEINVLQQRVGTLSAQLQATLEGREKRRRHAPLSPHQYHIREVKASNESSKSTTVTAQRQRMGRSASIATRQVLDSLALLPSAHDIQDHPSVARVMEMFQRPSAHMDYLNSQTFAKD